MLAEVVDAVVGGDTHRDTHALELTAPSGATIATLMIGNDERGFAEAIAWVAEHAPARGWWPPSSARRPAWSAPPTWCAAP